MNFVLTISQTLGRTLVFAVSFDPQSEISFITPILQMRKWRLREAKQLALGHRAEAEQGSNAALSDSLPTPQPSY